MEATTSRTALWDARRPAPTRAAAAGTTTLWIAAVSAATAFWVAAASAACSGSSPSPRPATAVGAAPDSGAPAAPDAAGDAAEPIAPPGGDVPGAWADAPAAADAPPAEAATAASTPPEACTPEQQRNLMDEVRRRVHEADPCFEGTVARADPGGPVQARYSAVVTQNFGLGFKVCRDAPAQGEAEARAAHAATSEPLPCVEPWTVTVHGDAQRDIGRLRNAVAQACGLRDEGASFVVLFDADGRVSDVQGTVRPDGVPADVRECVRRATEEMPLACLAGMAVCPEWQRQD